ncbi:Cyclic di-GMP phosphodiesterase PdeB [Ferriphaselus amnicola]|uniref:Cyclic di-GMP phosphodiesterase PdeB n=1 Tax=Ferriphaselus amnicola TaxID=1188319 RepID=A0A2Z6GAI3_9PROT|nr:GGDEF and EAL domain-containing protein [Ferriphaselus amnicola]BBE50571.1 Cyclic di-GMP phosphodiesterase PdeB [Ferriphaselus amnicola]
MTKLFYFIKRVTLGRLLLTLSIVSMILALVLLFVLSGVVRDRAVHDLARDEAKQTSKLVFQSLYSAMRKGWNKDEIKEVIGRLNKTMPRLDIRVYRGEMVAHQFGAMEGEGEVIAKDPMLMQALTDGKDLMEFTNEHELRYIYPVRATAECLVCHTESHVGAVHGVIDITYPVSEIKVSLTYLINSIVGYTLLVMAVVFIVLYVTLRYLVAQPIAELVDVIQRITHDMDLSHRIKGGHRIVELQRLAEYFNHLLSTVQEYNERMEELAVRDPLTGLYNRRKFDEFLEYEINRALRHEHKFSIIMADLDDFKFVNDTYGHPVGDMALKQMSMLLESSLRKGDLMARLGGDEFAIILPETSPEQALLVGQKLHRALADEPFDLPVGKVGLSASFSVVSFPSDGATNTELQTAMDVVLYKAKNHGKNQVLTSDSDPDGAETNIFRRGDFLRRALMEDRIDAFLQPIVSVKDGVPMAFEALARIRDGERLIAAGQFIEAAEELGMIRELDMRVFNKGLAQLQSMAHQYPEAKMFFNLSARTFADLDWVRSIPEQVLKMGIPCQRIVLEITEREALPHMGTVKGVIDELRSKGIAIALDDFGSGFSSFLYLKYLTVDYVKIEGGFVRQMAMDERDRIMVRHIHQVAKEFGLQTVAEFVEDAETAAILAEMGVDYAQGYHFGKPVASV